MGMYTGLRCKVIVKKEYLEELEKICDINNNYYWENSSIEIFKTFGDYDRSHFIPFGALSYMPDEWEDKNENATDGFDLKLDMHTGFWSFQCSLKNYSSTIEYFIENVLSKIVEEIIHLESYYEEFRYSTSYKIIKDVDLETNTVSDLIIADNHKFIDYDKYGM